jgi:multidrug efflux pump subunit AcrA (membrane-fusion protein)
MSLDQLTNHSPADPARPRRIPAWLLPTGLLVGFVVVFLILFGSRLLPALPVQTVPVITLRTAQAEFNHQPSTSANRQSGQTTGSLLFQASGWVEPDPFTIYVPTLVDGVVNEVLILEGQTVKKDQLLATLVDDDALLDVEEAERRIKSTESGRTAHCAEIPIIKARQAAARESIAAEEARLAQFVDTAKRLEAVNSGAVSEGDLIKAQLQVTAQEAAVAQARSELLRLDGELAKIAAERDAIDDTLLEAKTKLSRKKLALARTVIKAPVDGTVLRLHAAPGKKRMLGMDDPNSAVIAELYQPDKLQARIDVPLSEAAALGVNQPVILSTDLLPDLQFHGTVTRIVGEADMQRNTLQVKVRIHNPDPRLRPEMLVRAKFFPIPAGKLPPREGPGLAQSASTGRLALFAPKAALFDHSGSSAKAWIVDAGRAQLREVTLGTTKRDDHLLVASGLLSNDQLILPPHTGLSPNKRVKPTNP